jgi:hypothetical protein
MLPPGTMKGSGQAAGRLARCGNQRIQIKGITSLRVLGVTIGTRRYRPDPGSAAAYGATPAMADHRLHTSLPRRPLPCFE